MFGMRNVTNMTRACFNIRQWNPTKAQWLSAGACVQDEERKRISEFVFKEDSKSALIGRLLLRFTVSKLTDVPWNEIVLKRTDKGKPVIDFANTSNVLSKKFSAISVNISHSGDYVVAVGDKTREIGVDVMDIRKKHGDVDKFFDLMRKNFTDNEWSCIKCHNSEEAKMKSFYRHWCLKESFVKAIGKGIGYSLRKLNFNVDPNSDVHPGVLYSETKLDIENSRSSNWYFEETMIDDNHCVATAIKVSDPLSFHGSTSSPSHFVPVSFQDLEPYFQTLSPISEDFWTKFEKKLIKDL